MGGIRESGRTIVEDMAEGRMVWVGGEEREGRGWLVWLVRSAHTVQLHQSHPIHEPFAAVTAAVCVYLHISIYIIHRIQLIQDKTIHP